MVIIAGDLFETHKPEPALVEEVVAQLERLERAGVAVVTVPGNHDEITYADSVYRVHAGAGRACSCKMRCLNTYTRFILTARMCTCTVSHTQAG